MSQREAIAELKKLVERAKLLIEDIERDDARLSREDYDAGKAKFYIGQKVRLIAPNLPDADQKIVHIVAKPHPHPDDPEKWQWLVSPPYGSMDWHVREQDIEAVE